MWSNNKQSDSPNPAAAQPAAYQPPQSSANFNSQSGSGSVAVVPLQRSNGAQSGDLGTGTDGEGPDFGRRRFAN